MPPDAPQTLQIDPKIEIGELVLQYENRLAYANNRILVLAQTNAQAVAALGAAQAEIERLTALVPSETKPN